MIPSLRVRSDRPTVRPAGGTRYLLLDLEPVVPPAVSTVVVVDKLALEPYGEALVAKIAEQLAPAALLEFGDGALHLGWLQGCHAIAGERLTPGHCLLITDGHATLGENRARELSAQAAGVWEHTGIATSVVAVGPRPDRGLLKALAWPGGGWYLRSRPAEDLTILVPPPRLTLEFAHEPGIEVDLLSRTRAPGVVSGLKRVVASVTFRGEARPELRYRLRDWEETGEWQTLSFQVAPSSGPKHAGVMRRVAAVLARRTPSAPVPAGHTAEGAADLVGRFVPASCAWPSPAQPADTRTYQDLARGVLLWGAVGSALGRVLVGMEPATIRRRYGPEGLQHYELWRDDPDSRGQVSGDVQILREVAHCLLEGDGHFDPETFSVRLLALLADHRGLGSACEAAGAALGKGQPWWKAGRGAHSAGNGAALRVAPLALVWALAPQLSQLYREVVVSAVITHTHPVGVAGAVVMALAVAWCLRERCSQRELIPGELLAFLAESIQGLEPEPTPERRAGGQKITLCQRLRELEGLLARPPEEALLVTWNGAFALESVPAALYCFLKFPNDPRQALLTAVNAGSDADSVGAMTGQLAGAWHGEALLRHQQPSWFEGLEGRDELRELADRLVALRT